MTYIKTDWVNDSTPAINAENLNKIEQGIYDNSQSIDNILGSEVYSTDEVKTNKVWIDGKPIYRKVLSTVGLSVGTKKSINYNITNPDKIWIVGGFICSASRVVTLPMIGYDGDLSQKVDVWVETRENVVKLYSNGGWGNDWTFYIIIEYTKTTD